MDYFYAGQLRQYRLQFIRAFSNFNVNFGTESAPDLRRVPCRYGDSTRIAESIVRGNSENKLLSTPFISCIVSGLAMDGSRRQDPSLVEKVQVNEREYDEENQRYTQDIGNRYTVERYMPVPFKLTMQVDIWTSNLNQKEQLIEQILQLWNPAIDFQTSNNPLDWTFLSYIEMQENITWTSRSIPVGTDNPIDVLTLMFDMPIWINPPAKVKKQHLIEQIVIDIIQGQKEPNDVEWTEYEFLSRIIKTPENYSIKLTFVGNNTYEINLLSSGGSDKDSAKLATITDSKLNPVLIPGTVFAFNGIVIPIATNNMADFVDAAHLLLTNTEYSIQLHNKNSLRFINNSGESNTFSNVTGTPLTGLGLESTTYAGGTHAWWRLFEPFGHVKEYNEYGTNASQLRIIKSSNIEDNNSDIVGWINYHPTDQNRILWTVDSQSLPAMTIQPINAIIDPTKKGPGSGLPDTAVGQRYLLLSSLASNSALWGNINAGTNDIVEYTTSGWLVVFDSSTMALSNEFVLNLFSGKIYQWQDQEWSLYVEQNYAPGYWRISI